MKTIKKYRAINNRRLLFSIKVNGETRRCLFSGYDGYTDTNGSFITDDEELQNALESSPSFGSVYKLEHTDEIKTEEEVAEEKARFIEMHFPSLKKATEYIEKTYGYKAYKMRSQQVCIEKGREYGLNIIFDNAKE